MRHGRGRAGRGDLPPPLQGIELIHVKAGRPVPSSARRASSTPRRSARSSARRSSGSSRTARPAGVERRPVPGAGHALPRRHRVGHRATRPRSRATTTSAACPRTWTSSWSSRCGSCSRTRCGRSARSSACPRRSSGASRSPGPGLGVRIIGEVTAERVDDPPARRRHRARGDRAAGLEREIWQSFAVLPDSPLGRRHGRRAHLRLPDHHPGGHVRGRHDRRLGPPPLRPARAHRRAASSTRSPASTGWPTTSPPSPPAPSSGSEADRHNSRLSRRSAAGCVLGTLSRLHTTTRRKCGAIRDDRARRPGHGWASVRDLPDRAGTEVGQGSTSPRPLRRACPTSCRRDAGRWSVERVAYGGRRVDDPHVSGSSGQRVLRHWTRLI